MTWMFSLKRMIVQSPSTKLQKVIFMADYSTTVNALTVLSSGMFHDYKDSELQPFSDVGCIRRSQ